MKRFKNMFFVLVLGLLLIPFVTKADDDTICKTGCDYDSLDAFLSEVETWQGSGTDYINIMDSREYIIGDHNIADESLVFYSNNGSNINISGVTDGTKLTVDSIVFESDNNMVTLKNLNIYNTYSTECDDYMGMCPVVSMETNSMIDNVTINNKFSGLSLLKGYTHTVNKYTFNGNNFGIVLSGGDNTPYPNRAINISNSKLSNCACSLVAYDLMSIEKVKFTGKRVESTSEYSVKVDSSEVNCAKYGASDVTVASNPILYFTSSNKWTKLINKGTDFESNANVVEGYNSKIIIDQEASKTIKYNSRVSLQNYFDELKSVNSNDISWRVANPKILKIENGKVVPLKVGSTTVTATYNNMNYTINFRITSVPTNPNTGRNAFLIIVAVVAVCALIFPVALQGQTKQQQ